MQGLHAGSIAALALTAFAPMTLHALLPWPPFMMIKPMISWSPLPRISIESFYSIYGHIQLQIHNHGLDFHIVIDQKENGFGMMAHLIHMNILQKMKVKVKMQNHMWNSTGLYQSSCGELTVMILNLSPLSMKVLCFKYFFEDLCHL